MWTCYLPCGPILFNALVLDLTNANVPSLLYLFLSIKIQLGHLFLAIISMNITVPIVQTNVLGAMYEP